MPRKIRQQKRLQKIGIRFVNSAFIAGDDMAQSLHRELSRKTPPSINPFWKDLPRNPQSDWEKSRVQLKLAIFPPEKVAIDTLLGERPKKVVLPKEQKNEEPIAEPTEQSEQTFL